jgi:hypothetical protein
MEDDIKCILQDNQFHLQLKSEKKENRKIIGEAIYIRVLDRK